jgi:Flp pilus assembly protein TadG
VRISIKLMRKLNGSAPRGEEGAELVEFALCAWLLSMFIFGLVELCLVLFMYNTANEAARNTARWLSVNGAASCTPNGVSCVPSSAAITAHVQSLPGAAQMTPTVNWCSVSGSTTACSTTATATNAAAGSLVQVQVQYQFAKVPFISKEAMNATSTAQMVIWQ